mgnify:FL=1
MAYSGSTAASSVANPPFLVASGIVRSAASSTVSLGRQLWLYASTDSSTLAFGSNYFTDAFYIGMRQNDVVIQTYQSSVGSSQVLQIGSLGAVTTAGAALTTGGTITSTFN